jgi:hypothetical protein
LHGATERGDTAAFDARFGAALEHQRGPARELAVLEDPLARRRRRSAADRN